MNTSWKKDRRAGNYSARSTTCFYHVTKQNGAWYATVTEVDGRMFCLVLRTLHEALAVCEGHAHGVEAGSKTPTLHLSIYWDVSADERAKVA